MILLIDNYDSFVHNLARYFRLMGQTTRIVRNDAHEKGEVDLDEIFRRHPPDALVISPGPCTPAEAGCSVDLIRQRYATVPVLGICLGHQAIVNAFGGNIIRADRPVHGRTSQIHHDGKGLFRGFDNPFDACRYHSLIAEQATLPQCLNVTAWTEENTIMAVEHVSQAVFGIQFHPEAILTAFGEALIAAFLHRIDMISADAYRTILEKSRRDSLEKSEL